MNTLESCIIESPATLEEECAKFIIDEVLSPFVLHTITTENEEYTLSLWVKSDAEGDIYIRGKNIHTTTDWVYHVFSFTAVDSNLRFYFNVAGTYYIYHPQLELGNTATAYKPAPEDTDDKITQAQDTADESLATALEAKSQSETAESLIQQINDRIQMLVTDANGTSLMTQTADGGWTFSMGQTQATAEAIQKLLDELSKKLGSVDSTVTRLAGDISHAESSLEWVNVATYEDEPCIYLGETDSTFKLLITNTRLLFIDDTNTPLAEFTNQALSIKKAEIKEELRQGPFVWAVRSNGNMGLIWKG